MAAEVPVGQHHRVQGDGPPKQVEAKGILGKDDNLSMERGTWLKTPVINRMERSAMSSLL